MVDLWQVAGLRGTGSFSFQVDDLLIPEERTFVQEAPSWSTAPLYGIPTTLLFATGFATVALGVARKSLDIAIEVGRKPDSLPFRSAASRPPDHAAHHRRGPRAAEFGQVFPQGSARATVGVRLQQRHAHHR